MSIEIQGLYHTYMEKTPYEKHALKNINLRIKDGEFVCIVGHTGSGKTTLIGHLNGLIKPSNGRVIICGEEANSKKTLNRNTRLQVGLVFQYPEHQIFEETVYREVAFGPFNLGCDEIETEDRVSEAMRIVGLNSQYYNRSPFELSGGEKRRVAIASVLAMKPRILVLDEPVAGLDPRGRDDILSQIKKMHEANNTTIIMVTHSMDDVARYGERVVVMKNGEINFDGKTKDLFVNDKIISDAGLLEPAIVSVFKKIKNLGFGVSDRVCTVEQAKEEILRVMRG